MKAINCLFVGFTVC